MMKIKMAFAIWNADRARPVGEQFKRARDAYREAARLEADARDHYCVIRVPA